jgi:hypothetical protein
MTGTHRLVEGGTRQARAKPVAVLLMLAESFVVGAVVLLMLVA